MIKLKALFIIFFFVLNFAYTAENDGISKKENGQVGESSWNDFKTSLYNMYRGSYEQFRQKNNIYYLASAAPALYFSFEHDDRIVSLLSRKKIRKHESIISDSSILFNFPVVPIAGYIVGKKYSNNKLMMFSMEVFSTMYLASIEASLLSNIHIHNRPDDNGTTFWEDKFRRGSSFPSGHTIPFSTLFFKTFQYYGPYWAIIPGALAILTASERVKDKKHYLSDVVGSFFLTAFASEGVKAAMKSQYVSSAYQKIFGDNSFSVSAFYKYDTFAPIVTFKF